MFEVLLVDDDKESAKEYAELIENFTKLTCAVCTTYKEVIDVIENNDISVAVLDQKMPDISGTDLYHELKKRSPLTRAIMFSGEASQEDTASALKLGYKQYLHKSEVVKLPKFVLEEYLRFLAERSKAQNHEATLLSQVSLSFGLRGTIEYWLVATHIEDNNYVDEDNWKLIEQINCGETKTIKERIHIEDKLYFEQSFESQLSSNIGLSIKAKADFEAKLNMHFKENIKSTASLTKSITKETERTVNLAAEPNNPLDQFVRSRKFLWSPVFMKITCNLKKVIQPLNEEVPFSLNILRPTNRVATAQEEYLNDGTKRFIHTGTHVIGDPA